MGQGFVDVPLAPSQRRQPSDVSVTIRGGPEVSRSAGAPLPSFQVALPDRFVDVPLTPTQNRPSDTSRLTAAAPMAGETIGGMVGGLTRGRIGAVVGGAAGRGYGELVKHATEIPGAVVDVARNLIAEPVATLTGAAQGIAEGVKNVGISGARQGAFQLAGEGLAAGGSKAASWLMNRATSRISVRLARDFPELSDTLIQHALTVSKGGLGKARTLHTVAKNKATEALKVATAAGATVPIQLTDDLASSLRTVVIEHAMKTGHAASGTGQAVTVATERLSPTVRALLTKIEQAHKTGSDLALTPIEADMFKTQLQRESRNLYMAMRGPNGTPAIEQQAALKADFASRLNDAIDGIAGGYKAANAAAKPLIGAVRGIEQATRPSGNLYQAMVRPAVGAALGGSAGGSQGHPYLGAAAGAVLTSPAAMSREAIMLAHPTFQTLLKQMPRTTAAALMSFLTAREPQMQSSHLPEGPGVGR